MSSESRIDSEYLQEQGQSIEVLVGKIKDGLLTGAYDVLKNHHEDAIVISSGDHQYIHILTRQEAEKLDRAVWSAGEDESLEHILKNIQNGLRVAGFNLVGDHLEIRVQLREWPFGVTSS